MSITAIQPNLNVIIANKFSLQRVNLKTTNNIGKSAEPIHRQTRLISLTHLVINHTSVQIVELHLQDVKILINISN